MGAALARSHLVVFDPKDFQGEANGLHQSSYEKEGGKVESDLEEARLALLEKTIEDVEAVALGPTAIKVRIGPLVLAW